MEQLQKFRIFAQDVGVAGYSAVVDLDGMSAQDAVHFADREYPRWKGKHIALPHSRKDLWPDDKTGTVPPEALEL
jgi:hypothetical protein